MYRQGGYSLELPTASSASSPLMWCAPCSCAVAITRASCGSAPSVTLDPCGPRPVGEGGGDGAEGGGTVGRAAPGVRFATSTRDRRLSRLPPVCPRISSWTRSRSPGVPVNRLSVLKAVVRVGAGKLAL